MIRDRTMKAPSTGNDMWVEYCLYYGKDKAREICNRYLDMQMYSDDKEEIEFYKELYVAMQNNM